MKTICPIRLSHSVWQDLSLQNYTDVSLVPEEGEESSVRVHSLLLSAASPYLAGLLGGAGDHTVCLPGSVADPNSDPDQPDPHVFGPPGSGFGFGSGSFYHHAKIVRKTLIPTILCLFFTFYL
jgi:hypothetical protein